MSKPIDILIIDDEQVVRDAVSRVCETAGLTVEAASDAKTGLDKIQKDEYRLVVCDVMLPDLDAFQILEAMKQASLRTPVIMITGYSTMENAVNSLRRGAIDFIPKPFTADELESTIRRGLRYREIDRVRASSEIRKGDPSRFSVPCPAGFYCLGYSSWAVIEEKGTGLIGITDLFLKTVSAVNEIRFFALDDDLVQGSVCARVLSKDNLVHDVLSPLSGRIIESNVSLLPCPEMVEKDPYFSGWLYRIIPTDVAYELRQLIAWVENH